MNIQSYIDRKRIAGAREHEGKVTDWAGWTQEQFLAAIAGELLDAYSYNEKLCSIVDTELPVEYEAMRWNLATLLNILPVSALEAACQEAEQEAEAGEVTGKPYAELEAELAEAKRRAEWYLSRLIESEGHCVYCVACGSCVRKEPCNSCDYPERPNFTPAPVPADFEVKENG